MKPSEVIAYAREGNADRLDADPASPKYRSYNYGMCYWYEKVYHWSVLKVNEFYQKFLKK